MALNVSIDASGATQGANEFVRATDAMGDAAERTVSDVEKIAETLRRLRSAQAQGATGGFGELNLLRQQIAIQEQAKQGAISLAEAERRVGEAALFAATGNRQLAQQLSTARQEFAKNAQSLQEVRNATQQTGVAASGLGPILQQAFGVFTGITAATAVTGLLNGVKAIAQEGIRYNATLEQQRIGLASLVAAQDKIVDSQGRTVEGAEKFAAAQQVASGIIKDIQKDALETVATTEQLVDAFQQAKGPLTAAGLSLKEAQQATTLIVQAATAIGIPLRQVSQEVRAIADGQIDQNARLANALQIRQREVVAAREQGRLFEFINERLSAFALAGTAVQNSFNGLTSSIADISGQLLGRAFQAPFDLLKDALQGVLEFLLEVNRQLNNTKEILPQIKLPQTQAGVEIGAGSGAGAATQQTSQAAAAAQDAIKVYSFFRDVLSSVGTELKIVETGVQTLATGAAAGATDVAELAANLVGADKTADTFAKSALVLRQNLTRALKDSADATQEFTSQFGVGATAAERASGQFASVARSLTDTASAAKNLPSNLSLAAGAMLGLAQAAAQYNVEAQKTVEISPELAKAIRAAQLAAAQSSAALIEEGAAATGNASAFQDAALSRIEAARRTELATVTNVDQRAAIEEKFLNQQTAITGKIVEIKLSAEQRITQASQAQAETRAQAAEAEARRRLSSAEAALALTNTQIQALAGLANVEDKRATLTQQAAQQEQTVGQARVGSVQAQISAERARQEILRNSISLLQRVAEEERRRPIVQGNQGEALTQAANLAKITQGITQQNTELAQSQAKVQALGAEITSEQSKSVIARINGEQEVLKQQQENFQTQLKQTQQIEAVRAATAAVEQAQQQQAQTGLDNRIALEEEQLNLLKAQGASFDTLSAAENKLIALAKERAQSDIRAAENAVRLAQQQLSTVQARQAQIRDQIAATGETIELQGQLNTLLLEEQNAVAALTGAQTTLAGAQSAAAVEGIKAQQTILDLQKQQAERALVSTGTIRDFFTDFASGIAEGGQKLGAIFDDLGQSISTRFFSQLLVGKEEGFDKPIIENVSDLFGGNGILSSLIGQGGQGLLSNLFGGAGGGGGTEGLVFTQGQNFGEVFGTGFQGGFTQISDEVFAAGSAPLASSQASAATAGTSFGEIFGAAAGGAAGIGLGKGLAGALGVGGGKEAGLGGTIGGIGGAIGGGIIGSFFGPGGTALGAAIGGGVGSLFGSIIGGLFKSTPSKGTEIRKGVKDLLKDIQVTFASEIDSGEYFFEETKKLAQKMFGGSDGQDFLKASQIVLNDKIGPELSKQLQALGAALTADQAKKLGKSIEQTGTTFGNLLLDNLGVDPEKIGGAIQETVQKAGLSFAELATKLNSLFEDNLIGIEFYQDAIQGTVDIFNQDLPAAINVATITLRSFNEAGIFDVEKFQKDLQQVTDIFDVVTSSFVDVVKSAKPGEDVGKLLAEQIRDGFVDLAIDKFLKDFIETQLFEGIDLSNGIDEGEATKLKERAEAAAGAVGEIRDAFGQVADAAAEATEKATDLFDTIRDISQQRIDLRLNVIGDLQSIGAISPVEAARGRIAGQQGVLSALGASTRTTFTDAELAQGREAVRSLRQATVELFQAQEQEAQNALQNRIRDINAEFDAKRQSLQREAQAAAQASQARIDALQNEKDQVQELFQARIDALQEELQLAQEFRRVAEDLNQTITGLVQTSSNLSKPEQLGFLQQQASGIRGRIASATPEQLPDLLQQLSRNLTQQLDVGKGFLDPTAFNNLFNSVVGELEKARAQATEAGSRVEVIQQQIADTSAQSVAALASIDARIEQTRADAAAAQVAFQAQADALSQQEQAAVKAAESATTIEINKLRIEAADEIRNLAVIEDQILADQRDRALREAELTQEQIDVLGRLDLSINTLTGVIGNFLTDIISTGPTTTGGPSGQKLVLTSTDGNGTGAGQANTIAVNVNVPIQVGGASAANANVTENAIIQAVTADLKKGGKISAALKLGGK